MNGPLRSWLPDGRLRLQHGPIDLVIAAQGESGEAGAAYGRAWERFADVLETLVSELPLLRAPLERDRPFANGPVARRMVSACWPHRSQFITPMAAVAGAVADEILGTMLAGPRLRSAYVNNGGDIAIWVAPGASLRAGIADLPFKRALNATLEIKRPCGLATSGWRGRSQSLGIADAVTVLANNAADADAAATLIANAVDADHPEIRRAPACEVRHDSDLGRRLVTVAVGALPPDCAAAALDRGATAARAMQRAGWIRDAYLALQGRTRVVAAPPRVGCDKLSPMQLATSSC